VFRNENDRAPVAVLAEGQWSNWIPLHVKGVEAQLQLRLLTLSKEHLEIYSTPLFQSSFSPQIPYTYPLSLSSDFSKEIGQYITEGAGWLMYEDELTLDLLYENIESVGTQQVRASEYLLREIADWQLFIHIFTESDRVQHAYWQYFQPEAYPSIDKTLVTLHGGKINSIIEKIDKDIGKLLHYLPDENTAVIVVSDHGFKAGSERGNHSWEGMYILAGKGIKKSHGPLSLDIKSFPRASVLDVTPTILHLMGYSVGKDMDGRVLDNVLDEEMLECCPTQFVESYEHHSLNGGTSKQTIDESTKDQLRGLGYME
jgi:predicted AlkP superfamily phosphohydrolase/phosphomutase